MTNHFRLPSDVKRVELDDEMLPPQILQRHFVDTQALCNSATIYTTVRGAKNTIKHIVSTNFPRGVECGTLTKVEQRRCIQRVKDAFRNGENIDSQWLADKRADKISNSMSQARYHDRMKVRTYLQDLWPYIDMHRPLQFSDDVWKVEDNETETYQVL